MKYVLLTLATLMVLSCKKDYDGNRPSEPYTAELAFYDFVSGEKVKDIQMLRFPDSTTVRTDADGTYLTNRDYYSTLFQVRSATYLPLYYSLPGTIAEYAPGVTPLVAERSEGRKSYYRAGLFRKGTVRVHFRRTSAPLSNIEHGSFIQLSTDALSSADSVQPALRSYFMLEGLGQVEAQDTTLELPVFGGLYNRLHWDAYFLYPCATCGDDIGYDLKKGSLHPLKFEIGKNYDLLVEW